MKIAVYATSHGFGHLSRQLGWIEQINWQPEDEIFIINKNATRIINNNLDINLNIIPRSTDVGPVFQNETFNIDVNKTEQSLNKWESEIEKLVNIEKDFLRKENIELVVTDISPIPLESSYEVSIPSIAISSFSWHWIYESILPEHTILDTLKTMYNTSSETLVSCQV